MKYVCLFLLGATCFLRKAGGRPESRDVVPLVRPTRFPLGRGASAGQRPPGRYGHTGGCGREELQLDGRRDDLGAGWFRATTSESGRPGSVAEVRRLIFEGRYKEALRPAATRISLCTPGGRVLPHQTAGSLLLDFPGHRNVSDFYRDPDLATATATVGYAVDGSNVISGRCLLPFPIRWRSCGLTASERRRISFRGSRFATPMQNYRVTTQGNYRPLIDGRTDGHGTDPRPGGVPYGRGDFSGGRNDGRRQRRNYGDRSRCGYDPGFDRNQFQRLQRYFRRSGLPGRGLFDSGQKEVLQAVAGGSHRRLPSVDRTGFARFGAPTPRPPRRPTRGFASLPRISIPNWCRCTSSSAATC